MDNPLKGLKAPWISQDGEILIEKLPIDPYLEKALHPDYEVFRQGCMTLKMMHHRGKVGAAIYLLGLFHYYRDNLQRLTHVVDCLDTYQTRECAEALLSELRRVKSSNTTRNYHNKILRALSSFPLDMVENGLTELANDRLYTQKMRGKFKKVIANMRRDDSLFDDDY
ncbi:MAG: hypothetical protein HQL77_16830 [Magnetococcales bacterium]|nr:hypothetical protein [Magnetococcales bacterium]MBF0437017.1 hypothetical protein [Magnetococcales bacterium]